MATKTEKKIEGSFEEALKELEGLVKQLEQGQIPLEDAITLYERGVLLQAHCQKKLSDATLKIEQVTINAAP
jgi:exodeoxyribonuclease VII small subunit